MATIDKAFGYQGNNLRLPVKDLAAALPFYETMLGFRVLSRSDTPERSAMLARDQVRIGLVENGGDPTQDGCAFHVTGLEPLFAEFRANGVLKESSEFTIERRNVFVPSGLEVVAVLPAQVPVRLERLVHEQVPVRPRLTGTPASGLEVGEVTVTPATVRVFGPRLQLAGLGGMVTDPVNVEGAEQAVEVRVAVRSPHPLVRVEEPLVVNVRVTLAADGGRQR